MSQTSATEDHGFAPAGIGATGLTGRLAWLAPAGHSPITRQDLVAVLAVTVLFLAATLSVLWNQWAGDFSAYYYAGHFYGTGQFDQIYAGPPDVIGPEMPPLWAEAVAADGWGEEHTWPFVYLPWVAALFSVVAANVEPGPAMNASYIVNVVLLVASSIVAWRIMPTRMPLRSWLYLSYIPLVIGAAFALALSLGQIQILVFLACLLAIDRMQAGHPLASAFWLALATLLKITPAAFAILYLWNRQWTALAAFCATSLALAALGVALIGWPLHAEYFALVDKLNSQVLISLGSISSEGLLLQITDLIAGVPHHFVESESAYPKPQWQELLVKGLFVLGLWAIWHRTRATSPRRRAAHQFFALTLLLGLTVPLGWIHYFMLPGLLMPLLLDQQSRAGTGFFLANLLLFNMFSLIGLYYASIWFDRAIMPQYFIYVPFFAALFLYVTFGLRPDAPHGEPAGHA